MKQRSTYRPYSKGSLRAPLHARSTGHYQVNTGWGEQGQRKEFAELYWGVKGAVEFRQGENVWILRPDEVCFFLPGDVHCLKAIAGDSEYYWMTFDGPHLDFLIAAFGLERRSRPAGNCPVELFLRLERELRDLSLDGEYRAGATCYQILSVSRFNAGASENQAVEQFRELVEEHFQEPDTGIAEIAKEMNVHRSTLNRLIRSHLGLTPTEYLISFRLQEAMKLLRDTNYSIKEIAEATGFSDQNYFAKVISRRFDKTPSQFRKHG